MDELPFPGTWWRRPKIECGKGKILWWCYYPHQKGGKHNNGVAVIVDKEPVFTQLVRAQKKFAGFVKKQRIQLTDSTS